jgi:hypothetical protein
MLKRWLVLALTLYLSLDVANPLMPGAVTFTIDTPLELRQAERFRAHHDVVTPVPSFDRISGDADTCDEVMTTGLVLHDRASAAEGAVHGTITSAADRAAS